MAQRTRLIFCNKYLLIVFSTKECHAYHRICMTLGFFNVQLQFMLLIRRLYGDPFTTTVVTWTVAIRNV